MSHRKQVLLRKFKVEIFRPSDMDESESEDLIPDTDGLADVIEKALGTSLTAIDERLDHYVSEDDG